MNRVEISWRMQIGLVAAGYGAVLTFAAAMIAARYLTELRNPNDFNGGMAAAGDWFLELFIGGLLLIPTFFLAFVTRERESIFTAFAKTLFGFSLTAPLSFGLILISALGQSDTILGTLCLIRLSAAPVVLTWLASGRVLARFKTARRLLSSALMIEGITLVLFVGMSFL